MDTGMIVVVLVAAAAVGGLAAAMVLLLRRRPSRIGPPGRGPVPEALGAPRFYIALAVDAIFDLYWQTAEADATRTTTTSTRTSGVKVGTGGAPLTLQAGRGGSDQTETEYLPAKYAPRAVAIVERRLQAEGSITSFDLKTATDDGPLTILLNDLRDRAALIGLKVPEGVEKDLHEAWKQQSQLITDTTLESLGSFVRVRAEFTISHSPTHGDRVLESVRRGDAGIQVRIVCPRDDVRRSFPKGPGTITATCLGTTPSWDGEHRRLELQPISIHTS